MTTIRVAGIRSVSANLVRTLAPSPFVGNTVAVETPAGPEALLELIRVACPGVDGLGLALSSAAGDGGAVARLHTLWAPVARVNGARDRVWRIVEVLGSDTVGPSERAAASNADERPGILVVDEPTQPHAGFEVAADDLLSKGPAAVIWKAASLSQSKLLRVLGSPGAAAQPGRLTVVVSADALRARDAGLTRGLSWDRTVEDVIAEFSRGRSAADLARAGRVVVSFGLEGVAILEGEGDTVELRRFVYDPERLEGDWQRERAGWVFGETSILSAAITRHLAEPETYPLFIATSRALAAMRANLDLGAGAVKGATPDEVLTSFDPGNMAERLAPYLHPQAATKTRPAEAKAEERFRSWFPHRVLSVNDGKTDFVDAGSDLLGDVAGPSEHYLSATAVEVVLGGASKVLDSAPRLKCGNLVTYDRVEIERLAEVRRILSAYAAGSEMRPLSLAVFGPPGSGKSFAVKQLAEQLFGKGQNVLTFNVAQFETRADLIEAFNHVRDVSVRGGMPLVFFDEFDAASLRWLADFLAPMQDGEYSSGGTTHLLGRSILVFAGGTAATLERFVPKEMPEAEESEREEAEERVEAFRKAKGPDFVSRLRGYLDIKGTEKATADDETHVVRRAVLLRSLLERNLGRLVDPQSGRAQLSAGVVAAFIHTAKFSHGVRSMEAIVAMSDLENATFFGAAQLPSRELLASHVSADFMDQVRLGEIEYRSVEYLAEEIHEAWRKEKEAHGYKYGLVRCDIPPDLTHPLMMAYAILPESAKDSNRASARVALAKLHDNGLAYGADRAAIRAWAASLSEKAKQKLYRIEHDVWLRDHLIRGWAHATENKDEFLLHRDAVGFEEVPANDQVLDRVIVDGILAALSR